jgi:outer membrane protein OmpA-like peptidoglycan-associated protein
MSKIAARIIAFTSSVFISCSTVPKNAPQEFHDARSSLDRAKSEDAKAILPTTMGAAENNFDLALSNWKDAHNQPSSVERTTKMVEATNKVANVRKLSDEAIDLTNSIKSFDAGAKRSDGKYAATTDILGHVETLNNRMAGKEIYTTTEPQLKSPFAMVKSFTVQNSVAYFDTDKTALDPYYKASITEVARLLEQDPNLIVTVSGYADPRGTAEHNKRLSEERAQVVADALEENGVAKERVRLVAMGSNSAHFKKQSAKFQLERRVDATVTMRPASETENE